MRVPPKLNKKHVKYLIQCADHKRCMTVCIALCCEVHFNSSVGTDRNHVKKAEANYIFVGKSWLEFYLN